jgi:hypothetical protein
LVDSAQSFYADDAKTPASVPANGTEQENINQIGSKVRFKVPSDHFIEGLATWVAKPLLIHPSMPSGGLFGVSADLRDLERDTIKLNRIALFIYLWSRDVLRLTGSHLISTGPSVA